MILSISYSCLIEPHHILTIQVFIDYGEGWEKAWSEHVENWKAPDDASDYKPVRSMNDSGDFRTIDELKSEPYPENVLLVCFFNKCNEESEEDDNSSNESLEIEMDGRNFIPRHGIDAADDLYPCEVVEKTSRFYFTVRVQCPDDTKFLLTAYPKKSLTFRMKKLKSDQHLKGAFRHFIEIDDQMFPDKWKDKLNLP